MAAETTSADTKLSIWVYPGASGRLIHQPDALGNRIVDTSDVGYKGGTVPLPKSNMVSVKVTIAPVAGDYTLVSDGTLRIYSAPTPPPKIGALTLNRDNLAFSGSNGVPDWTYYVLASTNTAAPLSQWQRIATNAFEADGNFAFTNNFNPDAVPQFYVLQLP